MDQRSFMRWRESSLCEETPVAGAREKTTVREMVATTEEADEDAQDLHPVSLHEGQVGETGSRTVPHPLPAFLTILCVDLRETMRRASWPQTNPSSKTAASSLPLQRKRSCTWPRKLLLFTAMYNGNNFSLAISSLI